ncbi:MAG TPA: FMN-binding negative transcriptional regulator [Gammaproteobacteria bacterium]|nr:FMN-binding negative transcriptional regulator [Gammaproteobacteria bacterium]
MYIPKQFEETRVEVMHELMRANPLATLITLASAGLNANHIPFYLSPEPAPYGVLQGHVARANTVWTDFAKDTEALVIFHGPQAYISPSWYATKRETGEVLPTWNYITVHAYGSLRIKDDPAWLQAQLEALTSRNEADFQEPWKIADAPQDFTEKLIGAIVGIEIVITRLHGKWKLSQNQPERNRQGVIKGLESVGTGPALEMAEAVAKAAKGIS